MIIRNVCLCVSEYSILYSGFDIYAGGYGNSQ